MLNGFRRPTKFRVNQEAESHTEEKIAHKNCVQHTLTLFKAHTCTIILEKIVPSYLSFSNLKIILTISLSNIILTYQLIYTYINEE